MKKDAKKMEKGLITRTFDDHKSLDSPDYDFSAWQF